MKIKWILIYVVTLLLAAFTVYAGQQLINSWKDYNSSHNPDNIQPTEAKQIDDKDKDKDKPSLPIPLDRTTAYYSEFENIPEETIFSETRTRRVAEDKTVQLEVKPLQTKPILLATSIFENKKLNRALIIDPKAPTQNVAVATAAAPTVVSGSGTGTGASSIASSIQDLITSALGGGRTGGPGGGMQPGGGGRGQNRNIQAVQVKKIGDEYDGYEVKEITYDTMVLVRGTRQEVIPLHEGTKRTQNQGKTQNPGTQVVYFGGNSNQRGQQAGANPNQGRGGGQRGQQGGQNPAANPQPAAAQGGRTGRGTTATTTTATPGSGVIQIIDPGNIPAVDNIMRSLFGGTGGTTTTSPDGSAPSPFGGIMPGQ
jgi:hypothetical protein